MAAALVPVSRATSPISDPSTWQVVLVDPSRHVVLYNKAQNSFTVHSTRIRTSAVGYLTDSIVDDSDDEGSFVSRKFEREEDGDEDDDEIEEIVTERGESQTAAPHHDLRRSRPISETSATRDDASNSHLTTCPLCGHVSVRRSSRGRRHRSGGTASASRFETSRSMGGYDTPTQSKPLPLIATEKHYFNLLSEASSRANTPTTTRSGTPAGVDVDISDTTLDSKSTLNTGYYATFFQEVRLLGRGGAGSVHHVVHVLNGEKLGTFAVKKGEEGNGYSRFRPFRADSAATHVQLQWATLQIHCQPASNGFMRSFLADPVSLSCRLRILREVHLLESLNHPNIVTYHHAWVRSARPGCSLDGQSIDIERFARSNTVVYPPTLLRCRPYIF